MSDQKDRKRADGKRVALKTQEHEREYLIGELEESLNEVSRISVALGYISGRLARAHHRLRSGFPRKGRKAGK